MLVKLFDAKDIFFFSRITVNSKVLSSNIFYLTCGWTRKEWSLFCFFYGFIFLNICYLLRSRGKYPSIRWTYWRYQLGRTDEKIFCNSTTESTKKTYSVSLNHFLDSYVLLPSLRFIPNRLSLNGMILCFYTADLFRLPSVNSATSIENYARHLKST